MEGAGWGGRLFEARRLLTFSAFSMGAYSRRALIRGWVLIRINMVNSFNKSSSEISIKSLVIFFAVLSCLKGYFDRH